MGIDGGGGYAILPKPYGDTFLGGGGGGGGGRGGCRPMLPMYGQTRGIAWDPRHGRGNGKSSGAKRPGSGGGGGGGMENRGPGVKGFGKRGVGLAGRSLSTRGGSGEIKRSRSRGRARGRS